MQRVKSMVTKPVTSQHNPLVLWKGMKRAAEWKQRFYKWIQRTKSTFLAKCCLYPGCVAYRERQLTQQERMHKYVRKGHVSPHNAHTSLPLCPEKQAHRARKAYTYTKKKWHLEKGRGVLTRWMYVRKTRSSDVYNKKTRALIQGSTHTHTKKSHAYAKKRKSP